MNILRKVPLSPEAFAPFGEVIELKGAKRISINRGLTTRFHDLFTLDCLEGKVRPCVSVFRTDPLALPHRVEVMERHPMGSQAFISLDQEPFLVLVAPPEDRPAAADLILFQTNGHQGINLYRNTWHHSHIVLGHRRDFIVIDCTGSGSNLEEQWIDEAALIPEDVLA